MSARARASLALLDALDEGALPITALALIALAPGRWFAAATTLGAAGRGALHFSLWWAWFVAGALAVWLGTRALSVPLASGAARPLLTGPLSPTRWGFERLGAHALVALAAHAALGGAVVALHPGADTARWWAGVAAELLLLCGVGGLLGALLRPLPALALTLAVWWIGHLAGPAAAIVHQLGHPTVAAAALAMLPDLGMLAASPSAPGVAPPDPVRTLAWWAAWMATLTAGVAVVLQRRDL